VHLAKPLVEEAGNRWLDSWPIENLASFEEPPVTSKARHELLCEAASAIAILLRVVEFDAAPDKRRLVALIFRFISEVSRYLSLANLVALAQKTAKPRRLTLQQMADGITIRPNQDELERIANFDEQKQSFRALLMETGRDLASEHISACGTYHSALC
jgi:hypothetical protein